MFYDELGRFTAALTGSTTVKKDNSLLDVKSVLESLPTPPTVMLTEKKKGYSTRCELLIAFGREQFHLRCVISELTFAVMRSSVRIDGERKDWCWHNDPAEFKYEATPEHRQVLHSFISAIINAL